MSGEVEWCPILHVRPKFDVFTLYVLLLISAHTFGRNMRFRHINQLIILFLIR